MQGELTPWVSILVLLTLFGSVSADYASGGSYYSDRFASNLAGGSSGDSGYNATHTLTSNTGALAEGGGYSATVGLFAAYTSVTTTTTTTTTTASSGGGGGGHSEPATTTLPKTTTTVAPSTTLATTTTIESTTSTASTTSETTTTLETSTTLEPSTTTPTTLTPPSTGSTLTSIPEPGETPPTTPKTGVTVVENGVKNLLEGLFSGQPEKESPPTCSDGVRDQDEAALDCGGICPPCGQLSVDVGLIMRTYVDAGESFEINTLLKSNLDAGGLKATLKAPPGFKVLPNASIVIRLDEGVDEVVTWQVQVPKNAGNGQYNLTVVVADSEENVKSKASSSFLVTEPVSINLAGVVIELPSPRVVQDKSFTMMRMVFVVVYSNKNIVWISLLIIVLFAYVYYAGRRRRKGAVKRTLGLRDV